MKRKAKVKVDIDVVPYLSIMVIVLKLICLILIVLVMPIALNPQALKVLSLTEMFKTQRDKNAPLMLPTYFDLNPEGITIQPEGKSVSVADLQEANNPIRQALTRMQANTNANEYVVMIIRPNTVALYRQVRKMLTGLKIPVGYDVMEADAKVDWVAEAKRLNIQQGLP
jgi:hypothetical protein